MFYRRIFLDESFRNYMKIGLVHYMIYPAAGSGVGPLEESVKKIAADDFFELIETSWVKDPEVKENIRRIIQTAHMDQSYGVMPIQMRMGININDLDEDERKKAADILKGEIDNAYYFGAKAFALMSGKYSADKKEEAYSSLVRSTKELCTYAKFKGNIRVTVEVADHDFANKFLLGPVSLVERFAKEISGEFDNFGIMVDLAHIPLLHETIEESLTPIKDFIVHAHMGNCMMKDKTSPLFGDKHPRFGIPNSEIDVDELAHYFRVLKSIGFLDKNKKERPFVSIEILAAADEDPDVIIANAKRVFRQAWAKV
jgi:sugar phosphate isomerase/epimerase